MIPDSLITQEAVDQLTDAVTTLRFKVTDQQYCNGVAERRDVLAYQATSQVLAAIQSEVERRHEINSTGDNNER